MARKVFALVCVLLLVVVPLTVSAQDEIESVCLVTDIGKVNDGTFNQFAYEGMLSAADDFELDTTYIETTASTEYSNNVNTCVTEGYDVIIMVGFLSTDATYAAAEANPDIQFIGVDQFFPNPLPNLVGIQYREDQAGFLVGALAALMTESGTIGGVYGIPIPPVVKFRNGYEQGAKYVNPDINLLGVYIDNFNAADRGATAAEQLIGEGADVIFGAGGPTGSGAIVRAAALDTYVIGVDQDEYATSFGNGETPGAEYLISSAMKRVDNGVYDMLELLVDGGSFSADSLYVLSLENEGIDFAPAHDSDVPQEVIDQVNEIKAGLIDGSIETGVNPGDGSLLEGEGAPLVALTAEPAPEATEASS